MTLHTKEEKRIAREKLPEPISDFLGSEVLSTIYIGLQKKFNLNLRELMIIGEIGNVTLMGLETESSLETNLHQWMPELSNAVTHELVADMNDRLFKEAKRRLKENILEPKPIEEVLAPEPPQELSPEEIEENKRRERIEALEDNNPELIALEKKEEVEAAKLQAEQDKELEEALREAEADPKTTDEDGESTPEAKDTKLVAETTKSQSVVTEKLSISENKQGPDSQNTALPEKEKAQPAPAPTESAYKGSIDPYREPVE